MVLGLGLYKDMLNDINVNINISNNISSNTNISSLDIFGVGFLKRRLDIVIALILISFKYGFLPFIKDKYPLLYDSVVLFMDTYRPYIPITVTAWILLVTLYSFIELYVFLSYCSNNNYLKPPMDYNYLPKFIKNILNNSYEISKLDGREYYTRALYQGIIFSTTVGTLCLIGCYYYYI